MQMASIPVDLRLAKMLVLGAIFRCLDPVLSIAAILSSKPLFLSPMDKRTEAQKYVFFCRTRWNEPDIKPRGVCRARAAFTTGNSDLLTDAKAYAEASKISHYGALRTFCEDNFLSQTSVRDITSYVPHSQRLSLSHLISLACPVDQPPSSPSTSLHVTLKRLRTDFMGALRELGFSSRGASAELNENSDNENLMCVAPASVTDPSSGETDPLSPVSARSKSIVLGGLYPRIAVRRRVVTRLIVLDS